jgi:hypothetical protein
MLLAAGHDVQSPGDAVPPLVGADDPTHFAHAKANRLVFLTLNAHDFKSLHDQDADHPGIFVVHQDNDPSKDMSYAAIVAAIANLERTAVEISGGFWVLNAYRW